MSALVGVKTRVISASPKITLLAISEEIGDRKVEGACSLKLGNAYNKLGQYEKAIGYHNQALAISQGIVDRQSEDRQHCGIRGTAV